LKIATVKGSAAHNDYAALQKELKPVHDKLKAISSEMAKLSAEERKGEANDRLMSRLMETFKETRPVEEVFVRRHPNSYVSWNLVAGKTIIDDPQAHKALFNLLPQKFRNSEDGKQVLEKINIAFKTAIGQPAPQFTQNNTNEQPVALTSLKGKYVLIDFWASWCGPCRAENPSVVKAYNKFRDKNFEILAVSLDNKKEPWLEAIKKDGLTWLHVSDLKGWKNEVAVLYNVQAVPQNWLIDPNGIIIAKNMRGEELSKKLGELVK
jgi:peroxiredoxin